jgi:hypothetical protein
MGIFKKYSKGNQKKFGLICINYLMSSTNQASLLEFASTNKIPFSDIDITNASSEQLTENILSYFENNPDDGDKGGKMWLNHLGEHLIEIPSIAQHLIQFDFISKSELEGHFADWAADIKINVYETNEDDDYGVDLYLTKKDPTLKTETVFVLTGLEIKEKYNAEYLAKIEKSGEIADWKLFVTTPAGVAKIGLEKIIEDMKRINAWFYIVDPYTERVMGVTKGGKSKIRDDETRNAYIRKLPNQPIRAPSQVVKIATYDFKEKEAYNSKEYQTFCINTEKEGITKQMKNPEYEKLFENLLIIAKESGLALYTYSSKKSKVDEMMISGFLTALDSFVREMRTGAELHEIDYQNFKINAGMGERLKVIVVTNKSADKAFKERLSYFIKDFEKMYEPNITKFLNTGNRGVFNSQEIEDYFHEILNI